MRVWLSCLVRGGLATVLVLILAAGLWAALGGGSGIYFDQVIATFEIAEFASQAEADAMIQAVCPRVDRMAVCGARIR